MCYGKDVHKHTLSHAFYCSNVVCVFYMYTSIAADDDYNDSDNDVVSNDDDYFTINFYSSHYLFEFILCSHIL